MRGLQLLTLCFGLLLSLFSVAPVVYARSIAGSRLLVVLDTVDSKESYSNFLESLQERGFRISYKTAKDDMNLVVYDELAYDHLLVLAPQVKSFGGVLEVGDVIDFMDKGGNVLLAASSDISEAVRDLAYEFSADFDESGMGALDNFHNLNNDPTTILSSHFRGGKGIIPVEAQSNGPVAFRGVAHRLTGKNPLIQPVLTGNPTTYGYELGDTAPIGGNPILGTSVVLVSALQARNNARIVFTGSRDMFSNRLIKEMADAHNSAANMHFITALSKWVFKETGVLKVESRKHHRVNETEQHGIYRIKDEMVYEIDVSEWRENAWVPFIADDLQFEAVMLDPYIRTTFKRTEGSSTTAQRYVAQFQLPDKYGVFTFKVDYKRHGFTWLSEADTVQVRPFRHDQYPRFLSAAWPYYANVFSLLVAFTVFSTVFLWNKDSRRAKVKMT
ncbi:hypothetical protein HDU85_000727 [Gaertneriomyces sp. JEL0708]|nr:hypothetical protein HDU85_000727 [Gaertneriomyces sp. JEL0708]